jgi:hypothetical protein
MWMEATLGISLYSSLYLKLAKNAMLFLLSLMFSLQPNQEKKWEEQVLPESQVEKVAQTMYTHVSKCQKD